MTSSPAEDPASPYIRALSDITARLMNGEEQALRDVQLLLGKRTERVISSQLNGALSHAEFEEVLSLALFRLWERKDRFSPSRARLDRWFYVLARNAAIDRVRRRQRVREPVVVIVEDLDRLPAPSRYPDEREQSRLRRDLSIVLERLNESDRRILLSGRTETELSQELKLKPGTIRARRKRLKEKLRVALEAMGHVA
jgi:RNA polymerase sigma factor (sigma-70 family)